MNDFNWLVKKKSSTSKARTGIITTPHGIINTPAFIFCGTKAALKAVNTDDAKKSGTQIILSNTYHLMLQPGGDIIAKHGGLHNFMQWNGPMLTDSGGFQIFSLGHGSVSDEIKGRKSKNQKNKSLLEITEEGALFKSYIDGSKHLLTPEKSIFIQRQLGADLILVLDECTPFNIGKDYTSLAMERSHRWSKRSIKVFNEKNQFNPSHGSSGKQALYGIIQGGVYEDLRDASIEFNLKNNFFGLAIGGSLGFNKDQMYEVVNFISRRIDDYHPVHLLGIGEPKDIWNFIKLGIDTFDCVSPTRLARHGSVLIRNEKNRINITNSSYKQDLSPIDEFCKCSTCANYSKSYLNHLFKVNELVGFQLLTIHNMFYMNSLMLNIRKAIEKDDIENAEKEWYFN